MVRMPPEELSAIDEYIANEHDVPSRPEAMRRLIRVALKLR